MITSTIHYGKMNTHGYVQVQKVHIFSNVKPVEMTTIEVLHLSKNTNLRQNMKKVCPVQNYLLSVIWQVLKTIKLQKKKIEIAEIKIVSFIAEHNISINSVDHLVKMLLSLKLNDDSSKISCNRTKSTAIINNVIGLTDFDNIVNEMKTNQFSLMVDESTDISSIKHIALVVRMNIDWNIKDDF